MTAPASPELGTTSDATELIPGDPEAVRSFATHLGGLATNLETSGDNLKSVSLPSWQGQAADDFDEAFSGVPGLWIDAGDILEQCKTVLEQHADAIVTAQADAQRAIDAWEEGEQATAAAEQRHTQQVTEYNRLSPADRMYRQPPYFSDHEGSGLRSEARQILADARNALDDSGSETLTSLARISGGSLSGGSSQGPGAEGSWSWGSATSDQWKDQWGKDGWAGQDGAPSLGLSAVIASVNGSAWVWRAQGSTTHYVGPANGYLYADGNITTLGAGATASASLSEKGLELKGTAEAELVGVAGSAGYKTDYSTVEISGDAGVGAYADGSAKFSTEGVEIGGEVLLGAKAGVEGEATVGGIGLTGSVEGWAGAGAGADATFSWADGKLTIGAKAGLAWGLGGSAGVGLTLDFPEMGRTISNMWDEVSSWW